MKATKKIAAIMLALMLALSMTLTAFAQDVNGTGGNGSITIQNAAKGETYAIYKLFNATVAADSIAYTGTIPDALSAYFSKDVAGNITATEAANNGNKMSDDLNAALSTWAESATATATAVSDGTVLTFSTIPYGYYVITTTQGSNLISVTSTKPNAEIYDKNSSAPSDLTKTVNKDDVNIGDTVTYTVSFKTSNYEGSDSAAKKIVSYTIEDTLPAFLSNVNVTKIVVDNDANDATTDDQTNVTAQFSNKTIIIDWYDEDNNSFRYKNGAKVTITYTAVVTDSAAIDGAGNTNTVSLKWTLDDGTTTDGYETSETIYTYALALKKVNEKGEALAGAVFQLPFYVKNTVASDGAYVYAGTAPGTGLTNQLTTPATGLIVVKGVASGAYEITEVTAPDGYNKLTAPKSVSVVKTGQTTTKKTFYIDENGNESSTETTITVPVELNIAATPVLIINKTGIELPSTGGIGTTIIFVIGGALVLGAIVILVARKRMGKKN